MVDALIHDGDILIVDRSCKTARGRIVVASLSGGDKLLVKRLGVHDSRPALLSCNALHAYALIYLEGRIGDEEGSQE